MRDLAAFVMRGPRQAAIVAFVCTLIPMLFWLGAAVVGLVTLRQGFSKGLAILIWALIPALGWWLGMQDPGALVVLVNTLLMAAVLRATVSWQLTFVSGAAWSVLIGILIPWLAPELIEMLVGMADQVFQGLAKDADLEYTGEVQDSFRSLMIASFAATFFGIALGALCLARAWQAQLYNPGGWQEEFYRIRFEPKLLLGMMLAMFVAPYLGIDATLVFLIALLPILVCGIALVHGLIGMKKLGGQWLIGFYAVVVMLFPTTLFLIAMMAILDSVMNFRSRVESQSTP
jgi:phage shock protein PspC (stress-responsive transcriptional regulator)